MTEQTSTDSDTVSTPAIPAPADRVRIAGIAGDDPHPVSIVSEAEIVTEEVAVPLEQSHSPAVAELATLVQEVVDFLHHHFPGAAPGVPTTPAPQAGV